MKGKEIIKKGGKVIAVILRRGLKSSGLNFVTPPENPMQIALHNYKVKRVTNIHKSSIRKPIKISEFHKFVYITGGSAVVCLIGADLKNVIRKRLKTGDAIIIMNTSHRVIFSKGANAIEIKQGPYKSDI